MVRLAMYGLAFLLSAVMVSPAVADTVDFGTFPGGPVAVNSGWQGVTVDNSTTNFISTPAYWNNTSFDGPNFGMTIGNYMVSGDTDNLGSGAGGSGFTASTVQFWGNTDGSADTNISFLPVTGVGPNAKITLERAGNSDFNEFGYYLVSDGILHPLFSGPDGVGTSMGFNPGDGVAFGFYLKNTDLSSSDPAFGDTFRSNGVNTGDTNGNQHFAVFRSTVNAPESVWIGVEDIPFPGDRDYQDMIVRIDAVPEPATLLLMGAGLLAVGVGAKRLRRS
jgi:hypothetical protein